MSYTLTIENPFTREVSEQEVYDLITGTGAMSMPWWKSVKTYKSIDGGPAVYLEHDPAEEGGPLHTIVSLSDIVRAAGRALAPHLGATQGSDEHDAIHKGLGYLDAAGADNVLQIAVFGRAVFG